MSNVLSVHSHVRFHFSLRNLHHACLNWCTVSLDSLAPSAGIFFETFCLLRQWTDNQQRV